MLELKRETNSFVNKTGEVIQYNSYYVETQGIKVYLKPNDSTSKQLLDIAYNVPVK